MPSFTDKLLIQARNDSIRMEQLAAQDLLQNFEKYAKPSWSVNQMVKYYEHYTRTQKNTETGYRLLRQTFSETASQSHQMFSNVIAQHIGKQEYDYTKSIFEADDPENHVKTGLYHLKHHGFYKTRLKVPMPIVESLKAKILGHFDSVQDGVVEEMMKGSETAPRQVKTEAVWLATCEEIYKIAADPILLAMVQEYLGVPPIFNTPVAFLNSFRPVKTARELSDTAQLFHHDMHRLKFVKVFIYLTDVTMETGPHVMIPGTHHERPAALWKDGRHADETIAEHGLEGKETNIVGKAGTVFLVDTSALHKGAHPLSGSRLMAQVQYVNSLFGRAMAKSDRKIETSITSSKQHIHQAAEHVRKYAECSGTRFMQNYI